MSNNSLFKQRQTGTFAGTIKIILGNVSPYVNWLSLALLGVTSFYTTVSPVLANWGLRIPFWLFCIVLLLTLLSMVLVEWIYMIPSTFRANNVQAWNAGGPLQNKVTKIEGDIDTIKKSIANIKDLLDTERRT